MTLRTFLLVLAGAMLGALAPTQAAQSQQQSPSSDPDTSETTEASRAPNPALNVPSSPNALPPDSSESTPSVWRRLSRGWTVGLAFNQPLDKQSPRARRGVQQQGEHRTNQTVHLRLRYNPVSHWFGTFTIVEYLDPSTQASWDPDFTYVFGYDNWRPYTFSLTYSNYTGNKFDPDPDESVTQFTQGTLTLGWKAPLPNPLQKWLTVHSSSEIQHRFSLLTSPEYVNPAGDTRHWKTRLALNTRYNVYKWWYVNFTAYVYPSPSQQQPWDPDFTYGFGYFDWHSGTFSVQYNNYSGTRWPWRSSPDGTGRFRNGALSISWSYTF